MYIDYLNLFNQKNVGFSLTDPKPRHTYVTKQALFKMKVSSYHKLLVDWDPVSIIMNLHLVTTIAVISLQIVYHILL